jgi:hypothetical protein
MSMAATAPGTFGRSPGGRAANRDVHPWFASDSPLEEAVRSEPVSEMDWGIPRGLQHRYGDVTRLF